MQNPLCRLLNIDLPIVQAAMGGASPPALAAAVSNAGGLGFLALSWSSADAIREQIRATRALTSRPFGANLVLICPQEERLAICLEEGVPVISFFWSQSSTMIETSHRGGAKVLQTVGSADAAQFAVDEGADAIVAQGWEAGGHVHGSVATMALVPAVVDRVPETPVLAAGGIADGRGLAAALTLGACGAWIGTRFLASPESGIHTRYRQLLFSSRETDTEYGSLFDVGWPDAPHRSLRNTTIEAWETAGRPATGTRPGEGEVIATSPAGDEIMRYESYTPRDGTIGDIDALSLWAGQGVGIVRRMQPAGEIVREIAEQAKAILGRLGSVAAL